MLALGQGYGLTEHDTIGTLLETNVTVITIEECKEILRYNCSRGFVRRTLRKIFPDGLNDQILCAQGTQNERVSQAIKKYIKSIVLTKNI